jgi:hypothetical protein
MLPNVSGMYASREMRVEFLSLQLLSAWRAGLRSDVESSHEMRFREVVCVVKFYYLLEKEENNRKDIPAMRRKENSWGWGMTKTRRRGGCLLLAP